MHVLPRALLPTLFGSIFSVSLQHYLLLMFCAFLIALLICRPGGVHHGPLSEGALHAATDQAQVGS